jgi:hypothetical protein
MMLRARPETRPRASQRIREGSNISLLPAPYCSRCNIPRTLAQLTDCRRGRIPTAALAALAAAHPSEYAELLEAEQILIALGGL